MISIRILKGDGSVYWAEQFSKLDAAERWIAEEKTRPYWNEDYAIQITDTTEADRLKQEADAALLQVGTEKRNLRIEQLKTFAAKTSLTNAELQGVALALIKHVLSLD